MKFCSRCGERKSLDNFYSSTCKTHTDGLYPTCKTCKKKMSRQYALKNPEITKQNHKKYREKRKDYLSKLHKQWKYGGNINKAMLRASFKCERCRKEKNLIVHHKDRKGSTLPTIKQNNSLDNLEILCNSCHRTEHWKDKK